MMGRFFARFRRDITAVLWLSIGIFLGLSLWSYSPTDPSFNLSGASIDVKNFCGVVGSYLSDILLQLFGLGAWMFVAGCVLRSRHFFQNKENRPLGARTILGFVLVVMTSSLLALHWPETTIFSGAIYIGGSVGKIITAMMVAAFKPVGAGVIFWASELVLLVFFTEMSISEMVTGVSNAIKEKFFLVMFHIKKFGKSLIHKISEALSPSQSSKSSKPPISERAEGPIRLNANDVLESQQNGPSIEVHSGPTPAKRHIVMKKKVERRIENWELPKLSLLDDPPYNRKKVDEREIREKSQRLITKLKHFGIAGEVTDAKPGPAVTLFELKPSAEVKISRITDLADDLSLELSSESVRIIAPIPGRDVVGIETSNSVRETVYLKEILADESFWDEKTALPLALGCEANGSQKIVDLRKMPHMMVAGTTGSGKSVFVVSLLVGLLFRHSPKTLRLILIDPKQVDLAAFSKIPHLMMPPVREPRKAINALKWAIREMEKRYRSMAKFGARDLESFNRKVSEFTTTEKQQHDEINLEYEQANSLETYYFSPQPYIVIVVEEFGDLMAVDKQNVEHSVVRLAQMARACGLHLILAMQSPRKDVVTGLIKTNIPGRVSFKVASKLDSRIILDEAGAERLLSRGDMLFLAPGVSKPLRHHGPWLTDLEIQEVTKFWSDQAEPEFDPTAVKALDSAGRGAGPETDIGTTGDLFSEDDDSGDGVDPGADDRYDEILAYISTLKEVSASHIQMRFRLGYPRAARLMEIFESEGVVGPASGSKKRPVLVNDLSSRSL
jgi:S-DNA-T family DNA segregation ATPase FtsK/SpoIIIE